MHFRANMARFLIPKIKKETKDDDSKSHQQFIDFCFIASLNETGDSQKGGELFSTIEWLIWSEDIWGYFTVSSKLCLKSMS